MRAPGEGSLYLRKDGLWQAALQVDGRRRYLYAKTCDEAEKKLERLKMEAETHRARAAAEAARLAAQPPPDLHTVGQLLDAWLETHRPRVREITYGGYVSTCDVHIRPTFGNLVLDDVKPQHLERYYAELVQQGHKRAALKAHRMLDAAFRAAIRWEWCERNPAALVDPPKYRPQRKKMWSMEQLRAFLAGTRDTYLHPLYMLLFASGIRLGEALALTWEDIDWQTGKLDVAKSAHRVNGERIVTDPKTRSGLRRLTLPPEALEALRQQRERLRGGEMGQGLVFVGERTLEALDASVVARTMARQCARLGLPPMSPHGLRHMHASVLLQEGLSIPQVSRRLGHADASVTMHTYAHLLWPDDSPAAAAIGRVLG